MRSKLVHEVKPGPHIPETNTKTKPLKKRLEHPKMLMGDGCIPAVLVSSRASEGDMIHGAPMP